MKKITMTAVALFLVASLTAQQFSFGPRVGFQMQNLGGVQRIDGNRTGGNFYTPGFNIGLVAEYAFSESLAVQIGASFAQARDTWTENWGAGDDEEHGRWRTTINQLHIPINLQYNLLGTGIFFQAGPFLGFNLGGTRTEEGVRWDGTTRDESTNIVFGSEPAELDSEDLNLGRALNFGVGLGFGVDVSNLRLAFTYNIGISNMDNGQRMPDGTIETTDNLVRRHHGFTVTVSYMFGGGR